MQSKLEELYGLSDKYSFGENVEYDSIERYGSICSFKSENEIVQIGFRLGKRLNHNRIYGIDEDIELSDELYEKISSHIEINSQLGQLAKMQEIPQNIMELYELHNNYKYIRLDHNIYLNMNKINLGEYEGSRLVLQWYERNLKIFSNLQNICEKGDRVLVLIGSSHLKILRELIGASDELELVDGI